MLWIELVSGRRQPFVTGGNVNRLVDGLVEYAICRDDARKTDAAQEGSSECGRPPQGSDLRSELIERGLTQIDRLPFGQKEILAHQIVNET